MACRGRIWGLKGTYPYIPMTHLDGLEGGGARLKFARLELGEAFPFGIELSQPEPLPL